MRGFYVIYVSTEFGLVGQTMHKVNEHVAVADIDALVAIYQEFLRLKSI